LSEYDSQLQELLGRIGTEEAYMLLNQRIYEKIGQQYPKLERECRLQLERKKKKIGTRGSRVQIGDIRAMKLRCPGIYSREWSHAFNQ